jgi:hypothetical protein
LNSHYPAPDRTALSPLAREPVARYTTLFDDTHLMPLIAQIRRAEVLDRPYRARAA